MPAVTANTLTLPRVGGPGPADTERPVRSITTGPRGYEGEGFPVVRAFAGVSTAALDPFVHMDQLGEVDYQPGEPRGTDWHPHRGFETVTYLLDGKFAHQDSYGGGGLITDGATQWMTAGSGILHIETPPAELVDSGGLFHGIQLWVNLPRKDKFTPPRYQAIEAATSRYWPPTTAARCCASSPARSTGTTARASPTRRSRWRTRRSRTARGSTFRGGAISTRWCTCCPATATSARSRTRFVRGSWPCWGRVTGSPSARARSRIRGRIAAPLMCCCSAGGPFASRYSTTGLS